VVVVVLLDIVLVIIYLFIYLLLFYARSDEVTQLSVSMPLSCYIFSVR